MPFKEADKEFIDSNVFILAGDGCMMEGISSEASSFAGHLNLDNVILIYDSNDICLDGPTAECFSEDNNLAMNRTDGLSKPSMAIHLISFRKQLKKQRQHQNHR